MFCSTEVPVELEELDDYLKTILKFKIREFIHMSPFFEGIPSIDVNNYAYMRRTASDSSENIRPIGLAKGMRLLDECPNRHRVVGHRRPAARQVIL